MIDRQLVERIEQELREIQEIITQTEQFIERGRSTDASLYQEALSSAIALNLHSFYTGVERIFEVVARRIDYWEPTSEQWHRQLLDQMSLDIPQVRPTVISEATRTRLDEFRRFRHVVRSIYAYRLETSRVLELANQVQECHQEFEQEIRQFLESIQKEPS